ncbi:hypothetical protein HYW18_03325 [Candidatus Uhrbacteria bacterium]|nr:hypothetical protein [Candidatus Uhrbacteria bacterium]
MEIIATVSRKTFARDKVREIVDAGATILRYNLSHGEPEENRGKLCTAREVIAASGRRVRLLADLPGAKIRTGDFPEKEAPIEEGEIVTFRTGKESPGWKEYIPVNLEHFAIYLKVGSIFTTGDGEVAFEVTHIVSPSEVRAKSLVTGTHKNFKGLNFGPLIDDLDHCNDTTRAMMDILSEAKPELVAFSFVNSKEMLRRCKAELAERFTTEWAHPLIVSKVESPKGVEHIREIIEETDWVLIARGDLGLNVPMEELALAQKKITALCRAAAKPVIVSTQMLESSIDQYIPRRSDILDLSNAIFDGADGIMLCRETGLNDHPGHPIAVAKRIIDALTSRR